MRRSTFLSVCALFVLTTACTKKDEGATPAPVSSGAAAPAAEAPKTVLCLNAASTKDAMTTLAESFQKSTGITVKFSPEDSSKLANQIVEGAPADVFLSANEKWADFVKEKGFAEDTKPLLGNSLVVVVPKGNPAKVTKAEDMKAAAVKHIAIAGPTVPAGGYAKVALTSLKLWDDLDKAKKFTPGENVRSTLTFVERGEAEAGIVYLTDAKISDKVDVAYAFEPSTHPKIVYPLVLTKRGAKNETAKKWFDYVLSKDAVEVFKKYGFSSLTGS
jgi:molybdate transport system substrate-binding protein